jgi:hypothetical protein
VTQDAQDRSIDAVFVFSSAWAISEERPGYVLRLGVLVGARRLLYQSKPSIEVLDVNTLSGSCNPN